MNTALVGLLTLFLGFFIGRLTSDRDKRKGLNKAARGNSSREEVVADWNFVRTRRDWISRMQWSSSGIAGMPKPQVSDFCNTLVLVLAYGVLQKALQVLRDEGRFECRRNELGRLMKDSKKKLGWRDYKRVLKGKGRRDHVAHRNETLPRGESWEYVDAIDVELRTWGIAEGGSREQT